MRIMVTLDGSEFAEAVIAPVAQLANTANAEVFLVQVVEPSKVHNTWSGRPESFNEALQAEFTPGGTRVHEVAPGVSTPRVVESLGQALDRTVQDARDYLHHVAGRFAPIQPQVVVLMSDDVDEELARYARERHADMIAMATHGRTGLARLALGSHTGSMLRHRVAPLMIVRPDGLQQTEDSPPAGAREEVGRPRQT